MAILCGRMSCVAEGIDRKSVEVTPETGGSVGGGIGGGGNDVDVDALADVDASDEGTVGNRAAILSATDTGGTGAVGPGTLISGKIVLKLKLI